MILLLYSGTLFLMVHLQTARLAAYSQADLAKKLKLQQPAIARLERGGYMSTSVGKLSRIADALGYTIKISLSPKKRK